MDAKDGVYAYLRQLGGEKLVVVINHSLTEYKLHISVGSALHEGSKLHDQLSSNEAAVCSGMITGGPVPAGAGAVFLLW